jgi:hypothetical protein
LGELLLQNAERYMRLGSRANKSLGREFSFKIYFRPDASAPVIMTFSARATYFYDKSQGYYVGEVSLGSLKQFGRPHAIHCSNERRLAILSTMLLRVGGDWARETAAWGMGGGGSPRDFWIADSNMGRIKLSGR